MNSCNIQECMCCYWTLDSSRGKFSHLAQSCFETTSVLATPSGLVHCEEAKAVI